MVISNQLSERPTRVLRTAALACVGFAVVAAAAGAFSAHADVGFCVAAGLLLGAGNGFVAEKLLIAGVPFAVTSLSRLGFLTMIAVVAALVLGFNRAWAVVLGIALAQLALAGSAAFEALRH
ncbi:MAG: hypothetical protein JOY80_09050 [Candidatus Dormibacteraeota bacterium]|nr:hypothetical protein [Candidatus Dormibacteraeota bacterium]